MSVRRGDVVLVDFPQGSRQPPKRRPALVVQSDHNNARLQNTIVVMITSNTSRAGREANQVLIDITTTEGQQSGLLQTSAVTCENLYTFACTSLRRTIGRLPDRLMAQVDAALKVSLSL